MESSKNYSEIVSTSFRDKKGHQKNSKKQNKTNPGVITPPNQSLFPNLASLFAFHFFPKGYLFQSRKKKKKKKRSTYTKKLTVLSQTRLLYIVLSLSILQFIPKSGPQIYKFGA